MKKKLLSVALVIAMTLSLAACGGGKKEESTGEKSEGKGTVEFWTCWTVGEETEKESLKKIEEFEEQTGYKVNVTTYTYDMLHDKVLAAAAGGNTPDLIWALPEYIGEFYNMGILEDLTDAYTDWEDKEAFSDAVIDAMKIDGKIVGIPYEMTVRAYLTHEDMIEESAVPVTWDDLLAMNKYKEDTGTYPFIISATGVRSPQELLVYLAQYGLEICEEQEDGKYKNTWLDDEEKSAKAAKVFEFYQELFQNEVVDPSAKNWGWEESDENFVTGLTASHVSGNWLSEREQSNPDTMDDISVHAIPYPEGGQQATYMECKPLMVFNTSQNKEGGIELAKAIAGYDWQNAALTERSPRSDVFTDAKWSKDFSELADTGIVFPPVTLGGVTQAMTDSIAKVLQEGKTPEEAATWLADAINSSLKQSGELSE